MEDREAWRGKATSICDQLYNFFVGHFTSQSAKLVTLGRQSSTPRRSGVEKDDGFQPIADVPIGDSAGRGKARRGGTSAVPFSGAREEEGAGTRGHEVKVHMPLNPHPNIDEMSGEFIRSRKEALRSGSGLRRPSRGPGRQ